MTGTPSGGFIWCHMCCWRHPGGGVGDEDGLVTTHVKYYSRMSESDSNIELSQPQQQQVSDFISLHSAFGEIDFRQNNVDGKLTSLCANNFKCFIFSV